MPIIGGQRPVSDMELWRFAVKLENAGGDCSGVVIGRRQVLTAAHCFERTPANTYEVYANLSDEPLMKVANATHVTIHPGFGATFHPTATGEQVKSDDIAILHLDRDLPESLRAPKLLQSDRQITPSTKLLMVGYGSLNNGGPTTNELWQGIFAAIPSGANGVWSIDGQSESAGCGGDSGSPVFVSTNLGLELAGIFTNGSCTPDRNTMRSIPYYSNWIQQQL